MNTPQPAKLAEGAGPETARPLSAVGPEFVALSYAAILRQVPTELYGKLAPAGAAGSQFAVRRAEVLEQLPKGSVKVPFGLLRQNAPAGVFINSTAYDGKLIDLPLSEILSQMEPQAFARRLDQRVVTVAPELTDIFGAKGERITTTPASKNVAAPPTAPLLRHTVLMTAAAAPIKPSPAPPQRITPPVQSLSLSQPAIPPAATKPASTVVGNPVPSAPIRPVVSSKTFVPSKAAAPLPRQMPSLAASILERADSAIFLLALGEVANCWPEPVRQELSQLKLPDAKCAFPTSEICDGLKRGKIQYRWKQVRAWIQDAGTPDAPSVYAEVVLDFPPEHHHPAVSRVHSFHAQPPYGGQRGAHH